MVGSGVAQDNKLAGKVSGYVMGDYYYMVGHDTAKAFGKTQFANTAKDMQGFQIRRMYLIYDQPLSDNFAMQTIIEGTDASTDPGGRLGIYLKAAFMEWKNIFHNSNVRVGLIPTLDWTNSEKIWNYRSLEKTSMDQRALGLPTDLGVSLRGTLDADAMFGYGVMISNGNGFKPESNKFKKFSGEFIAKPVKELSLEVVADYEPWVKDSNKTTIKGLVAYQAEKFTVGAEYIQQTMAKGGGDTATTLDLSPQVISLFAWAPIPGVEGLNGIVRYDMFNPNTAVSDKGYKENFLVVGVDYMPIPNVHIMPNIWMNTYAAKGSGTRDGDVAARVSFFYIYK